MSKRTYQQYSPEFKREAVRLAEQTDGPITQVARELGVRVNQIYKWRREINEKQGDAFPGKGRRPAREDEIVRLRREVERLRMENEILKKAKAYFAREPK
ncbi:MAG: transposase [Lysobacterales bacterium]|jgi:transposase